MPAGERSVNRKTKRIGGIACRRGVVLFTAVAARAINEAEAVWRIGH